MEIAVLGAGVYLASALLTGDDGKQVPLQMDEATEQETKLQTTRDFLMQEARERGTIAPQYGNISSRVPWHHLNAPYYLDRIGDDTLSEPTENLYKRIVNPRIHEAADMMEGVARSRQAFSRKAGNAFYTGFTPEMYLPKDGGMSSTNIGPLTWIPKNPHDSDYNYATNMARAVPRDPLLFTPESDFATAAGLPFRYSNY
jgi:hypothetical protein